MFYFSVFLKTSFRQCIFQTIRHTIFNELDIFDNLHFLLKDFDTNILKCSNYTVMIYNYNIFREQTTIFERIVQFFIYFPENHKLGEIGQRKIRTTRFYSPRFPPSLHYS